MLSHRLQDPRPILSPEQKQQCDRKWSGPRPSEMTARPLAGSQCAHLRVPILVSKAQRAFYKEQREFSLAQGSDFLPCSSDLMKACGSTPGPLPSANNLNSQLRLPACPPETGLILSCAGKVWPPYRKSRGIDPPVTIRRGEGA